MTEEIRELAKDLFVSYCSLASGEVPLTDLELSELAKSAIAAAKVFVEEWVDETI